MTLKPALVVVLLLCVGTRPAIAQEITGGVKGGVNLATIPEFGSAVGETDLDTAMRTALAIGGFVAFAAGDRFDIQPEVFYVQKGIRFEGSAGPFPGGDATIKLAYIEIPVLAVYRFASDRSRTGYLLAGPAVAFNTSARIDAAGIDDDLEAADDEVKDTEVSLIFGGGYSFGRLLVEARWTEGLTAVNDASVLVEDDVRNRAFTILFGVRF
jgi:Outer membrane protein beta-barrel domain